MPVYRSDDGELREFPQDALAVEEPVFTLGGWQWDPEAGEAGEMAALLDRRLKVWRRVLDYRLLPLQEVKKLLRS